jgi:hypothetical protein
MTKRGAYEFEINAAGHVLDTPENLERLRRLFRDGRIIDGEWGPGNPGDFDHGSWHILCHLAGGSGVYRAPGGYRWAGITHDGAADRYRATVSFAEGGAVRTVPLAEGTLGNARLLGFLEGSSVGHISARGVRDARTAFNNWPRQAFDRPVDDDDDGGTVWEQWCVTRDIRPSAPIGDSALRAYLSLVSLFGGRFVAAVARGRREHEHPRHLAALVKAGLLARAEATWDVQPAAIPAALEGRLLEARPADTLAAVAELAWDERSPRYYMYRRRINRWSRAAEVNDDLVRYGAV